MNVLSLFDGMSCGQIALNRCGIEYSNYYASEIDKYAIIVTQHNYPNTIQLGDITKTSGYDLPKIDLLIGGSPCQGFSIAGKGLNFEDHRSKLFFEYVRILKEIKPKYFLLENVKMKKEWQDIITKYLEVEPIEINSALVSAQNRKRLYWTNISDIKQPENKHIYLKDILETHSEYIKISKHKKYNIDDLVENFKDCVRKNILNNYDYIIKSNEDIFQCKVNSGFQDNKVGIKKSPTLRAGNSFVLGLTKDYRIRRLTPIECERLQTVDDNYTLVPYKNKMMSNSQRYKMLGNGWTVDVIVHIFNYLKEDIS